MIINYLKLKLQIKGLSTRNSKDQDQLIKRYIKPQPYPQPQTNNYSMDFRIHCTNKKILFFKIF